MQKGTDCPEGETLGKVEDEMGEEGDKKRKRGHLKNRK